MSEKSQGTAETMREKMNHRYGDEHQHKHNKNHLTYRKHFKSHPRGGGSEVDKSTCESSARGLSGQFKLRNTRKRLEKGHFH